MGSQERNVLRESAQMKRQLELLTGEWDVLIVLDACRYDVFAEVYRGARPVRSPANCTPTWVRKALPLMTWKIRAYYCANPVVGRELQKMGLLGFPLVPLWEKLWQEHTPEKVPSVSPLAVAGYVIGQRAEPPFVVHLLQPHSPYIGHVPLKVARWGRGRPQITLRCSRLPNPERLVRDGKLTWDEVRRAYRANIELAMEAVRIIAGNYSGRKIVVTSDHGELLGKGERFGHEAHWRDRELFIVPWYEMGAVAEQPPMMEKLAALGYV